MNSKTPLVTVDVNEVLREHWRGLRNTGIVLIVLGVLALVLPLAAALAIELLLGWLLLAGGVVQSVHAFRTPSAARFWWQLGIGVLYTIGGLLLLLNPLQGVLTLTVVLSVLFLLEGVFKLLLALQLRAARGWTWLLVSGLLALVLGVLLLADLPGTAVWALGLMLGINLLIGGMALVSLAQAAQRDNHI